MDDGGMEDRVEMKDNAGGGGSNRHPEPQPGGKTRRGVEQCLQKRNQTDGEKGATPPPIWSPCVTMAVRWLLMAQSANKTFETTSEGGWKTKRRTLSLLGRDRTIEPQRGSERRKKSME